MKLSYYYVDTSQNSGESQNYEFTTTSSSSSRNVYIIFGIKSIGLNTFQHGIIIHFVPFHIISNRKYSYCHCGYAQLYTISQQSSDWFTGDQYFFPLCFVKQYI